MEGQGSGCTRVQNDMKISESEYAKINVEFTRSVYVSKTQNAGGYKCEVQHNLVEKHWIVQRLNSFANMHW